MRAALGFFASKEMCIRDRDETDQAKTTVCQTGPNTWQVSGDTDPEDLFEAIGFVDKNFDSDYATVGGWALEILEHIPEPGETFHYKEDVYKRQGVVRTAFQDIVMHYATIVG